MTRTARVACVIPTHRRPDLLTECLASVAAQEVPPSQIVVVSDEPSPESRAACDEAAGRGISVVYVERDIYATGGPGASASRNYGASLVDADYIAFLDDDDLWAPDYLSRTLRRAQTTRAGIVLAQVEIFNEDVVFDAPPVRRGLRAQDVAVESRGATGSNFFVASPTFHDLGGFDPTLPVKNDTDLFYRALLAGVRYEVVDDRVVRQRKHRQGQLMGASLTRARGIDAYIRKHRDTLTLAHRRRLAVQRHRVLMRLADRPLRKWNHRALALLNAGPADIVSAVANRRVRRHVQVPGIAEEAS